MQLISEPIVIVPHLAHVFIFDFNELKPRKAIIINNKGIKNNKIRILPKKLIKKLIPKIGIIINKINEKVIRLLFFFKKEFITLYFTSSSINQRHSCNDDTPALSKI